MLCYSQISIMASGSIARLEKIVPSGSVQDKQILLLGKSQLKLTCPLGKRHRGGSRFFFGGGSTLSNGITDW